MSWLDQIGHVIEQYAGGGTPQPGRVEEHFDQAASAAPQDALASGIAAAFRSDQTPPFDQLAAQLFGQANGPQRAGILNTLLGAVGPGVVSQVLSQFGLSHLGGAIAGGGLTPELANQVPPDAVQQVAASAQAMDPSVVDALGGLAAQHPDLVKSLGGSLMAAVLGNLGR